MKRRAIVFLATSVVLSWTSPALGQSSESPLRIHASAEVAAIDGLDRLFVKLNEKMGDCTKGHQNRLNPCVCANQSEIRAFTANYSTLIEQHPDWRGHAVSFLRSPADAVPVILSFSALENQLSIFGRQSRVASDRRKADAGKPTNTSAGLHGSPQKSGIAVDDLKTQVHFEGVEVPVVVQQLQAIGDAPRRNDRIRRWAQIPEMENRFLRVILLPDGETVHNAFFDRGFTP